MLKLEGKIASSLPSMASTPHLPEEIVEYILLKLPVKALLRFRYVCRSWGAIIENPSFAAKHNAAAGRRDGDHVALLLHDKKIFSTISGDQVDHFEHLNFPLRWNKGFGLIGHCNGIICGHFLGECFLWNPATTEFRVIPPPRYLHHPLFGDKGEPYFEEEWGFGFDSKNDDYKVVKFHFIWWDIEPSSMPYRVEVYSLKSGSWEYIENPLPNYVIRNCPCAQDRSVNGFVFWYAAYGHDEMFELDDDVLAYRFEIILLDLETMVLQSVELPMQALLFSSKSRTVTVLNESIAFCCSHPTEGASAAWDVWVLTGIGHNVARGSVLSQSWVKRFCIALTFVPREATLLGFSNNGELLCHNAAAEDGKQLAWYCPVTHQFRNVQAEAQYFQFTSYRESLISIGGDKKFTV